MGHKNDKKIRQLFRREIKGNIKELSLQHYKDGPVFKVKHKYCPQWLWDKAVDLIMDEAFMIRYSMYLKQQNENRDITG